MPGPVILPPKLGIKLDCSQAGDGLQFWLDSTLYHVLTQDGESQALPNYPKHTPEPPRHGTQGCSAVPASPPLSFP